MRIPSKTCVATLLQPQNMPDQWFLVLLFCPVAVVVYRLKLSAVSQVPGPFFARISVMWKIWHLLRGDFHHAIREAHQRYGISDH